MDIFDLNSAEKDRVQCCIPASVANDMMFKTVTLLFVWVFLCDNAFVPLMVRVFY